MTQTVLGDCKAGQTLLALLVQYCGTKLRGCKGPFSPPFPPHPTPELPLCCKGKQPPLSPGHLHSPAHWVGGGNPILVASGDSYWKPVLQTLSRHGPHLKQDPPREQKYEIRRILFS